MSLRMEVKNLVTGDLGLYNAITAAWLTSQFSIEYCNT